MRDVANALVQLRRPSSTATSSPRTRVTPTVASFQHVGGPPPPIDLKGVIDALLRKDTELPEVVPRPDRERKRGVVHPSEAGGCLRRVALELAGAPQDRHYPDPQMERVFHVGHQTHHRVQGYLRRAAELGVKERLTGLQVTGFQENLLAPWPALKIDGELDCAVRVGEVWYVVEIKSSKGSVFSKLRVPMPKWVGQLDLYMLASGARGGVIIVENKDDQQLRQFFSPYDRERLKGRADGLKIAIAAADGKGPWPGIEPDHCYFCNLKEACKVYPHEKAT